MKPVFVALAVGSVIGGIAYLIFRTERIEHRRRVDMSTLDTRLSGIADRLSAKMDELGGSITEIQGDMTELKDDLADEGVSSETLDKFAALETKIGTLATAAREVADIVPESETGTGDTGIGTDTGLPTDTGTVLPTGTDGAGDVVTDADAPAGGSSTPIDDGFGTNGPTGP